MAPFSSCLQCFPTSVFSNKLALPSRWPKYWSFSFSISLSNEYSGLTTFRIDWFALLTVQETLKSLLQHSAFFKVQLSHPYMTIGKMIASTIQTFAGKLMSLLSNTPFRFVIAFLPRSKSLLISWLQSSSTVIWEPKKMKSDTYSLFICLK